jgi:hypothetical protein
MMNSITLLKEADDYGLRLAFEPPNTLTVEPARLCPPEFANTLRAHKPQLLALLQTRGLSWIEVYSERVGETLIFCENDATRGALVEAGVSEWSVYTRDELRTLCVQNRVAR